MLKHLIAACLVGAMAAYLKQSLMTNHQITSSDNYSNWMLRSLFSTSTSTTTTKTTITKMTSPFYSFKVTDYQGKPFDMQQLRGKVVMVVNTASECGFTNQYKGLQQVYDKYKDQGLVVLGFPCNQFGGQEPGSEQEIHSFCQRNFGVSFPLMAKVDVNGDKAHPLFEWLKNERKQLMMSRIKWNFEKFLVDKEGKVHDRYASTTTPESMQKDIEKLLSAKL